MSPGCRRVIEQSSSLLLSQHQLHHHSTLDQIQHTVVVLSRDGHGGSLLRREGVSLMTGIKEATHIGLLLLMCNACREVVKALEKTRGQFEVWAGAGAGSQVS